MSAAKGSAAKSTAAGGSQIRELGVAGLAIIDAVRVEFGPGLTVLTGRRAPERASSWMPLRWHAVRVQTRARFVLVKIGCEWTS